MSANGGERTGADRGQGASSGGEERRSQLPLLILVVIVVGVLVALNRVLPNIDLQQALQDISSKLGAFTYVLVGFCGLHRDRGLRGARAAGRDRGDPRWRARRTGRDLGRADDRRRMGLRPAGDSVSFLLGRRLGREFLLRHGPKVRITHERFARVEGYFSRHGGKTIVIGRFIGLVRALAPFTAGSSGMRYGYYLPFSVVGTGLWAAAFVADRVLRLAEPRRGGPNRRPGHAPVRDRRRR